MFQPNSASRYPNFLLFGWQRDDGDFECQAALNGDQIDDWRSWNHLVEQTYGILSYAMDVEIVVLEREELISVLVPETAGELPEGEPVKVWMLDEDDDSTGEE
jgi:hypothetical protein